MKILSLNVNGEKLNNVDSINKMMEICDVELYCFQESKYELHKGARINTVNYFKKENKVCQKNSDVYKNIWDRSFFWLEYPENYIAESEISLKSSTFILINVHLAGFYSGKRYPLMSTLLERLEKVDLKKKNVILLGDFNAQDADNTKSKCLVEGSKYLNGLKDKGFNELFMEKEKSPIATYIDRSNNAFRYDHVFVRLKEDSKIKVSIERYFPESTTDNDNKGWYSDHRGIVIEILERDYSDK
mgnify:FL=1